MLLLVILIFSFLTLSTIIFNCLLIKYHQPLINTNKITNLNKQSKITNNTTEWSKYLKIK